jgi:hypothetical protein
MISYGKALIILMQIIVFICLCVSYVFIESDVYEYYGFLYYFKIDDLLYGMALFIISIIIVHTRKKEDFTFALANMYLVFNVIPAILFFIFYPEIKVSILLSHIIFIFVLYAFSYINIPIKIVQLSFNQILFVLIAFLLVILVPYIVVYVQT